MPDDCQARPDWIISSDGGFSPAGPAFGKNTGPRPKSRARGTGATTGGDFTEVNERFFASLRMTIALIGMTTLIVILSEAKNLRHL
jgi:hypothetical protein